MLGGNGKEVLESERMKFVSEILARGAVDFIHRKRNRLADLPQHLGQVAIGAGDLGSAINQKNDLRSPIERHAGLLQDLARYQLGVVLNDSAGIDQSKRPPQILGLGRGSGRA